MKGLMFYDAHINGLGGQHYYCNICGRQITDSKAWVYREGDILLLFCGDTADCRDEFFKLNKLQDMGELHNLYPKLEEYQRTKSITVATDCMEWLAKVLKIDDEKQQFNGGEK